MSHALVVVIGDDPESQMDRYRNWYDTETESYCGYWDWYVIGGRFSTELILKDWSTCDQSLNRNIDWEAMDSRHCAKFPDTKYTQWSPFAVLIDGDWRQKSTLAMFGETMGDGDPKAFYDGWIEYRASIGPTRLVTVIDYHN